ncbi:hypothetical protein [Spongiibacter sp.]|uniref:hypothetical protein n=1 Tax=Spongiibacter sp. TaxID=2024860 RepID=UPI0035687876
MLLSKSLPVGVIMAAKILVSLGVVVYALVVPLLEINASHVFNSDWPPHARLHEVWQLTTNCALGVLSLWLVWRRNDIRLASVLGIIVMGAVLFAHMLEDYYGGSLLSGNIERTILGINLVALTAAVVVFMALLALALDAFQGPAKRAEQ